MFDFVVQIRADFMHNVFNEMRTTGRPFLQETLDQIEPIQIGPATIAPVLNLPDDDFGLALDPEDQMVEVSMTSIPLQLDAQNLPGIGDVLIEGDVSMMLRLPIGTQTADGAVRAGFNTTELEAANVLVGLDTGHPLNDEALVIDLLDRAVQDLYADGGVPSTRHFDGLPSPIPGTAFDAFVRFVNDVGFIDMRRARVEPSSQPNHVRITVPLEIWANLVATDNGTIQQHVSFDADVHIEVPRIVDLMPNPGERASISLLLPEGDLSLAIVRLHQGQELLDDPIVAGAIESFATVAVQEVLNDIGVLQVDVFTLDDILTLLRTLILNALTNPGRFVPFWEARQSEETTDIAARIIEEDGGGGGILAIGLNAGPGANLFSETDMIPANRDFAIRLDDEALIEELDANLIAPSEYDDVDGDLVTTFANEGSSKLTVAGFDDAGGTFRRNTRFRLAGFVYTVTADADIETDGDSIVAELSITPNLQTDVGPGGEVSVQFGVGLPITQDAGGNDRTFRVNDDLTASFQDGSVRLGGTGRLRRPNAIIFRNIDVSLSMLLGLEWASTARVNGGGQTGADLDVDVLESTVRELPENSLIIVDDEIEPRRLISTADPSGGGTTLQVTPELEQAPDDGSMVSLRWLRVGRVGAGEQVGDTLRVVDMTYGEGLIPRGTRISIDGERFVVADDAEVDGSGNVTVTLTEALTEEFDDGPPDDEPVRFFGAWDGRGVVDGPDQTGSSLQLAEVVRTIPNTTTMTIGGLPGLFTVDGTTDIIDDEATLTMRHLALEQLGGLIDVDHDELWSVIGQPSSGLAVRRRSGAQAPELTLLDNPDVVPDVDLGDLLGGVIGAIVGVLLTVLTGGGLLLGIVAGVVTGFVVKAIAERLISNAINEEAEGLLGAVPIPFPDRLADLGVAIDALFNNPIDITTDGLIIAGRAVASSVFPDLAESRARANGPYEFRAGMAGNYAGGNLAPETAYTWLTGDGGELPGLAPSHTYPRRGTYTADLSSIDDQLGLGVQTRQLAAATVRNTRPDAGTVPIITGFEGEEVELELSFTDVAWLDTHEAFVDWGDGTLPTLAEVSEVTEPPQTTGTVTARHTYCDNGIYVVTIVLTDTPGGEARVLTEAHIENVPPVVDTGPDVYAHPCVPTRLVGHFTDQGWCDTHTGVWDFGDCSPPMSAFIEETNLAPQAEGTATASHCYTACGVFVATLTITDDDGASTLNSLIVSYSDLRNGSFEDGFERQPLGNVSRHWTGYPSAVSSSTAQQQVFDCEFCIVCSGQRSQAIRALGLEHAGVRQQLGVNPGWEYQVTAMVQVRARSSSVWLGLDPAGGTDRSADSIVWRHVTGADGWQPLATRAVAETETLTVFAEVRGATGAPAFIDCVELLAYPCVPVEDPDDPRETPPDPVCIDWRDVDFKVFGSSATFGGWEFATQSGELLRLATFGEPAGQPKLAIPDRPDLLEVVFDTEQQAISVRVGGPPGSLITATAVDLGGGVVDVAESATGGPRTLELTGPDIARVRFESVLRGTIIELCATPEPSRTPPTIPPVFGIERPLPPPG